VVGVDGFFLLSGYLITKSFLNSKTYTDYLLKRILRIVPGYFVAFWISFLFVGWLGGGTPFTMLRDNWLKPVLHLAFLGDPYVDGVFHGLPFAYVNGSMWTIGYEFRCYLLVALLGALGLLHRRAIYIAIPALLIPIGLTHLLSLHFPYESNLPYYVVTGTLANDARFIAVFLCGGAFYLFRDKVVYSPLGATLAAILLGPALFIPWLSEVALTVLGGYLLFWFALCVTSKRLARVGNGIDLSYGMYLYAWPIQILLIWYFPHISPWIVFVIATPLSALCGYVSWTVVEKPFLNLKQYVSWPTQAAA
jgi:peptidoglycan/LPS O-acetylase OafA/YrhL